MIRPLLAVLLALPLLAACGSGVAAGNGDVPTGDYVSDGLPGPFDEGDRLRVTFREGEISFQATCNTMFGTADWDDDVLQVSSVGGTEMGCPGAGHEQDEWLVEFFTSSPTLSTLDVGFELTHDGTSLRLLPPDAAPSQDDVPLGSVVWELTGIEQTDGDAVSMMPRADGTVATVDITGTRFRMETGCNTASATVYVDDDSIQFKEILITERGCPADWREQEQLQLQVLGDGLTWSVDGDQLRLTSGAITLLYTAP